MAASASLGQVGKEFARRSPGSVRYWIGWWNRRCVGIRVKGEFTEAVMGDQ